MRRWTIATALAESMLVRYAGSPLRMVQVRRHLSPLLSSPHHSSPLLSHYISPLTSHLSLVLTLEQVGANKGDFDVVNDHKDALDPVRSAVRQLLRSEQTRAVLVEANPPIFTQLAAGLSRFLNGSSERVTAVNAMMCAGGVERAHCSPLLLSS